MVDSVDNTDNTLGQWVPFTYDLTPWAGQAISLQWEMTTDGLFSTSFAVDDITLIAN